MALQYLVGQVIGAVPIIVRAFTQEEIRATGMGQKIIRPSRIAGKENLFSFVTES
jgi:hypothetical protein